MGSGLTGSTLERAAICASSAALEKVDSVNAKQTAGSERHDDLAHDPAQAVEILDGLGLAPEEAVYDREVAFAIDVDSGVVRKLEGSRKYDGIGPREVGGTADLVVRNKSSLLVVDYKTGRPEFVQHAAINLQLHFYALCAARFHGFQAADVALVFIPEDGEPWADTASLDSIDLDGFALDLRRIMDRVQKARADLAAGKQPAVVEGEHCRFCRSYSRCPAKTSLVRAAFADPEKVAAEISDLAPDDWGRAWARYKLWEDALRKVRDVLHGAARMEGGIPLPGGKVVREVQTSRREIDGDAAESVLTELAGPEAARAIVERSVTQAGIKRVLGAAKLRQVMAALDEAGAISLKSRAEIRECDP